MSKIQILHFADWNDILKKSEITAKLEIVVNDIDSYPLFFEMDNNPSLKGPLGGNIKYTRLFMSEALVNEYIEQKQYTSAFIADTEIESSYINFLLNIISNKNEDTDFKISISPYIDFDESMSYMTLEFVLNDFIRELSLCSIFYNYHFENNNTFNNSRWAKIGKAILRYNHFIPEEFELLIEDANISDSILNKDYLEYFLKFPLSNFGVFIELSKKYKNCASKFCKNAPDDANVIYVNLESFAKQQLEVIEEE